MSALLEDRCTARLRLTRICEADLPDLRFMYADPQVMATLGGIRSEADTLALLQRQFAQWDNNGFGRWTARELDSGRFVGRGGLQRLEVGGRLEVEVGYALMPEYWGQGLATELAAESVRVGFEVLKLPELACFTLPTNLASRRVMEKVGFRYEREVVHADLLHFFFRLRAAEYKP